MDASEVTRDSDYMSTDDHVSLLVDMLHKQDEVMAAHQSFEITQ
jgi:hypothetical protein